MSEAVLISIRPKWCEKIANGEKTIEIRKRRPKIETPFKCYIYCTNGGDMLYSVNGKVHPCNTFEINLKENSRVSELNGYVIGEFTCDYIVVDMHGELELFFEHHACVTVEEQREYAPAGDIYGWQISDLMIYDEPKPLREFYKPVGSDCCKKCGYWEQEKCFHTAEAPPVKHCKITRPPQSWCYVEELP